MYQGEGVLNGNYNPVFWVYLLADLSVYLSCSFLVFKKVLFEFGSFTEPFLFRIIILSYY
jgi:hypothetical protein